MKKFIVFVLFLFTLATGQKFPFKIKNFGISNCNKQIIDLENIEVTTDKGGNLIFSGTVNSETDLEPPIKLNLQLKKKIFGFWIPVPCIDNIGSCTFNDLCKFGENEVCPQVLSDNNIPCRCPIPKGNYTVPQTISLFSEGYDNIESGKYIGRANVYHKSTKLGCFDFKFTLY